MAKRKSTKTTGKFVTYAPTVTVAALTRDERKYTMRVLKVLRKRFDDGDNEALFDAIDFAARAGMRLPPWVGQAYVKGYEEWKNFRAASLDEAFGVKRKKGMHIDKHALRERIKARVVLEVMREQRKGKTIDPELFEIIGKRLGCGKTVASEVYYGTKSPNLWPKILPALKPRNLD